MLFNKTFLFTSLGALNRALREPVFAPPNAKHLSCICDEKIILGIRTSEPLKTIRIWRGYTYFGLWHDDFTTSQFLGALDYTICEDHIKIEYMNIYDAEYLRNGINYSKSAHLETRSAMQLNNAMIAHVKNVARAENKPKIVVDVHGNLRIFHKYYEVEGFSATEKRCSDNPYWVEAVLHL